MNNVLFAFGLTIIAGLSTGIGSCIAFFAKKSNTKFLSASLGFSAGVMIYVSMIEIFANAQQFLQVQFGNKTGTLITIISFFGGMLMVEIIDKLIPNIENPHKGKPVDSIRTRVSNEKQLMRTGLLTALAIGIHNFHEGIATFVSAMQDPNIAIPIVFAIAIHNIPEGMAVSVPIYYATGNREKAFLYSFASGLFEPMGALLGYLILMPFMNDAIYGILIAGVAGIMVFISINELLPTAREYGEDNLAICGLVVGMVVMAISIWMFM